jgi:superfamily I DNA/RNA helicase
MVLDAFQRIYARGFLWREVGIDYASAQKFRLKGNHRNTRQIAALALPIIEDLAADDDGTMPDLTQCKNDEIGETPRVVTGTFSQQVSYALEYISHIPQDESIGFLFAKGGRFLSYIRQRLREANFPYHNITRADEWPGGECNIVVSTMHSAKGLEFDHVLLLGLSQIATQHGEGDEDSNLLTLRRLFAMAIARAKKSVMLGYKPGEQSSLLGYLDSDTYIEVPQ